MNISSYTPKDLRSSFGIDMSAVDGLAVGAGWARVAPGGRSDAHQHDESEVFVIVAGEGTVRVNGERHPVAAGTVVAFDPFETHVIENTTTDTDLIFATLYWRDAERAVRAAGSRARRGFDDHPVFVFSTPPTPNGDLHLGHLAGPYLGADVFVRFQRMNGTDAWHLTGSDDFQSYVVDVAEREGRTPAGAAAHYSAEIAATLALMDIEPDRYTVTAQDPAYPDAVRRFFSRLVSSGTVVPKEGSALFDAGSGGYLYEVDVHGGCPSCGAPAGGNICEECGEPNSPADLVVPEARQSSTPPVRSTATRYSLPLHELRDDIFTHHRSGRVPARVRELAERVFGHPTLDVALTHPSSWGVAPAETETPGQVVWVWPEMSYGFLYGIEVLGRGLGKDWRADEPQQDWQIVHFFGYDNSFYHGILYPALYKLAFPSWTPRIDYHVNEFYLLEGEKFSTSRRHAVWGKQILTPESVDAVRFFLSLTRPEGRRTDFSRAAYETVLRETLIGGWQTWLNDLGGRVETAHSGLAPDAGVWTPEHTAFLGRLSDRLGELTTSLGKDRFSLNDAAAALDGIVQDAIRFARAESLLLAGGDWEAEARTATGLELAAAQLLALGAAPVMPRFASRLAKALGEPAPDRWPDGVELLTPGNEVRLHHEEFFGTHGEEAAAGAEEPS